MELSDEVKKYIQQKAVEYFNTQKFTFKNHQTGAVIEYNPLNACDMRLPVNAITQAVLHSFLQFLCKNETKFSDLVKDLKLPPIES